MSRVNYPTRPLHRYDESEDSHLGSVGDTATAVMAETTSAGCGIPD
ncbi:hypothetical protein [Haloarcula marina]|nr:hypothetical protein [Halomicroarcula marina]